MTNYTENLIAMIPKACWCNSNWSQEQKAGFFLAICLSANIDMEFVKEFIYLSYKYDIVGNENGIYYPYCISRDRVRWALKAIEEKPHILVEIRNNLDILKEIHKKRP